MDLLTKEQKELLADFLDSIRDYERESHNLIGFDERETSEFVELYEEVLCDRQNRDTGEGQSNIPDVSNAKRTCFFCENELAQWQPNGDNICNACADKIKAEKHDC